MDRTTDPLDIILRLDRSKIETICVAAVGDFLMRLNVYKSTADAVDGTKFYVDATTVPESWNEIRDIVLKKKQPRKMFVQGNTSVGEDGKVVFKDYEPTMAGVIQSYIERAI